MTGKAAVQSAPIAQKPAGPKREYWEMQGRM